MIKKIKKVIFRNHSSKDTNSYRNENGFQTFVEDYARFLDIRDLYF